MKKNILAAALVAGLGLAGTAAAYTYGTNPAAAGTTEPGLATPENVAYQNLLGPSYNYQMTEALIFDIEAPDNIVQLTQGFTIRVRLNRNNCTQVVIPPGGGTPMIDAICQNTADGAKFNTAAPPLPGEFYLDPLLVAAGWLVDFDAYYDNGETASFRIIPSQNAGDPINPSVGTMLTWTNARLTSLDEFASGATTKVDAEFWMVNAANDSRFFGSTKDKRILARVSGVTACATQDGADVDKYIDVADRWADTTMPKSRFSFDGRLGSAEQSGPDSQYINLGDVTITNAGAGSFAFLGTDAFTTVISGGPGDNWLAFDNDHNSPSTLYNDDVWLSTTGTCTSGSIGAGLQGEVQGNTVTFRYTATQAGLPITPGFATTRLTVCAYADSDIVIDDHNNAVSTSFTRVGAPPTATFNDPSCSLLPLRYNGSTMEIFTINPGSNSTQRSFIRLTNRSATDGYVSLVGIDDAGNEGVSQVRVWLGAGESVQLNALDLEDGTNGAIGGWGPMQDFGDGRAHKWRAVVTAEFPGLVASSLVNSASSGVALANITDTDTRGEQYNRDWSEGNIANTPGERPADYIQETSPDFRGNGQSNQQPGGPNASDGPAGGTTDPCGNPGDGDGNALDAGHDQSNEDPYCYPQEVR